MKPMLISTKHLYEKIFENCQLKDVALLFEQSITYEQLLNKIEEHRLSLVHQGIHTGDRVALQMNPSFSFIYLALAVWKHDCELMLIDSRLKSNEVDYLLTSAKPSHFIYSNTNTGFLPRFHEQVEYDIQNLEIDDNRRQHQYSLILNSSGSTGVPKIIGRSSESIIEELNRNDSYKGFLKKEDTTLVLSSFCHSYGFISGLLYSFYKGGTLTFSLSNQKQDIIHSIEENQVTAVLGVPFHYDLLSSGTESMNFPKLRLAISAGDLLSEAIYQRFYKIFSLKIGQMYGMSEVGLISLDALGEYPASVGLVSKLPEYKFESEHLSIKVGMNPYLTEVSDDRYSDGWLKTNDLCVVEKINNEDVLIVKGRADSLKIIGGLKVYLAEIELKLVQYPLIEKVLVTFNEEHQFIEAYLMTNSTFELSDLQQWCHNNLADYKIPKRFHITDQLPMTATGKMKRNEVNRIKTVGILNDKSN